MKGYRIGIDMRKAVHFPRRLGHTAQADGDDDGSHRTTPCSCELVSRDFSLYSTIHRRNLKALVSSGQGFRPLKMNGVKTGSNDKAGFCLAFSATRNGRHLIGAELRTNSFAQLFSDARTLMDLGFSS